MTSHIICNVTRVLLKYSNSINHWYLHLDCCAVSFSFSVCLPMCKLMEDFTIYSGALRTKSMAFEAILS